MIRSTFRPKTPPRERRDRSAEFASFAPRERKAARCSAELSAALDGIARLAVQRIAPKTPNRKRQDIRDSAKGEECLMRLPGCPRDPALTIWSHNRHQRAGKGAAVKALDLNGCYACGCYCDAIYDGQRNPPAGMTREAVELAWYHAHAESLVRLAQKGLV